MKLWIDGKEGTPGASIRATVAGQVTDINRQVISRGVRAVNAMRSAELKVLQGQRNGRVYKVPGTYGKTASKATRKLKAEYGHKLRGGQLYRASRPGEAPARRTGNLRMHWNGQVRTESAAGGGVAVIAELTSQEDYAAVLENGSARVAPRPFVEQIKEKARPEIEKIYGEPYR